MTKMGLFASAAAIGLLIAISAPLSAAWAEDAAQATTQQSNVSEVIVTAQKQGDQRLQDVPIPIAVLQGDQLAESDHVLLRDYASTVPGLNLLPGVNGIQSLSIRGITTGIGISTVAFMVDDVPYGASTNINELPDIDPGDLARIEVMRGPQGTLYGDSSLGGLVNLVTKTPRFDSFSGRVEAGSDFTTNGAEPGYSLRASANLPISQNVAIRVSAFERQDAGYIDNPTLGLKGVNDGQAYGGRMALLWQVSSDTSLGLSALDQYTKSNGVPYVVPSLGGLDQNYFAGTGGENRTAQAVSATFKTKIGGVSMTSLTGYNHSVFNNSIDFSANFGSSAKSLFNVAGSPLVSHFETEKFSEELRFGGSLSKQIDWLVGGFYTHENSPGYSYAEATNPLTGQVVGQLGSLPQPGNVEEYAGFANLTYHLNEKFDIQVGGRETHVSVAYPQNTYTGIFAAVNPATETAANTFTYLVSPSYKISPDLMVYARFASGFRPGKANTAFVIAKGAPAAQTPDYTHNYEVGLKGDFLDHRLSIDASAYYIDWSGIQINSTLGLFSYGANGGSARSTGVDLAMTAKPVDGLTVGGWIAYDGAELTTNFPANSTLLGVRGDQLPFTPKFSANLSVDERFPLTERVSGFVGGQLGYVGDRAGVFGPTAVRQSYPSYTQVDLKAGVQYETWKASLYVNNIGDVRGQLNGGLGSNIPNNGFIYIKPRTVGFNIEKTF